MSLVDLLTTVIINQHSLSMEKQRAAPAQMLSFVLKWTGSREKAKQTTYNKAHLKKSVTVEGYVVQWKFTPLYITIRPPFLSALYFLNHRTSVSLRSCATWQKAICERRNRVRGPDAGPTKIPTKSTVHATVLKLSPNCSPNTAETLVHLNSLQIMKSITQFFFKACKTSKTSSHNFCSVVTKFAREHLQTVLHKRVNKWSYTAGLTSSQLAQWVRSWFLVSGVVGLRPSKDDDDDDDDDDRSKCQMFSTWNTRQLSWWWHHSKPLN